MNEEVEQQIAQPAPPEPEDVPPVDPIDNQAIIFPQEFPDDLLMEDADLALMDDDDLQAQDPHLLGMPVVQNNLQLGRVQLLEDNSEHHQFVLQNKKLATGGLSDLQREFCHS